MTQKTKTEPLVGPVVRMNFGGGGTSKRSKQLQPALLDPKKGVRYGQLRAKTPTAHWNAVIAMATCSYETQTQITMMVRPVSKTHPDIVYIVYIQLPHKA